MVKSVHFIPLDIIHFILLKLPVKTLGQFKTVCKSWNALISDPQFIISQFKVSAPRVNYCNISARRFSTTSLNDRTIEDVIVQGEPAMYPFDDEFAETVSVCNKSTRVLGSCNGLLLIGLTSSTLLWNPTTGKYKVIACGIRDITRKAIYYITALGYNSLRDEYKAILFVFEASLSCIFMYFCINRGSNTCGYGDWKKMDVDHEFPYCFQGNPEWAKDDGSYNIGTTFNGNPHWAVSDFNSDNQYPCYNVIIYFDMVEEKFERLPTPSSWEMYPIVNVAVFEGCLSTSNVTGDLYSGAIWSMKQYGVKESWTKMFVIRLHSVLTLRPLVMIKKGDGIIYVNCRNVWVYHIITTIKKYVFSVKDFGVVHMESLVSP